MIQKKTTKKQIQRNFNIVLALFAFLLLSVVMRQFIQIEEPKSQFPFTVESISKEVQAYTPILKEELKRLNLEEYTVVLAAIMEQESKGRGGDPMQASESVGLAPNSINDPKKSIQAGVKHFANTLSYGNKKNVDFPTIIQSYNMGMGYIDFVAGNGGRHSEELAKQFSESQVQKNPTLYNCGGDRSNFRYPYCYGDFTYSTKVARNIEILTAASS